MACFRAILTSRQECLLLSQQCFGKGYVPGTSYAMTFSGGGISPTIVQATGHAVANANGEIHQVDLVLDSLGAFAAPPVRRVHATEPPAHDCLAFERRPGPPIADHAIGREALQRLLGRP